MCCIFDGNYTFGNGYELNYSYSNGDVMSYLMLIIIVIEIINDSAMVIIICILRVLAIAKL